MNTGKTGNKGNRLQNLDVQRSKSVPCSPMPSYKGHDKTWLIENRIDNAKDEWLDVKEAAAYLKIPIGSLRNLTSSGQVAHYKLFRRVRYRKSDLRSLLQRKGDFYGN